MDFYDIQMFEIFLSGFKCQWDTIRKISFDIIRLFPHNLPYFTPEFKDKKILLPSKNVLLISPIIRDIEAATYSLSLLFERCVNAEERLGFVEQLVEDMSVKQRAMRESFFEGKKDFSQHLFHGLLTTFSIILGEWNNFLQLFRADKERAKKLYTKAMDELGQTISFAKAVIAKNHVTFILDNKETEEVVRKKKEKYQKLMEKIESANTLLEAYDGDEDESGAQSDNMTVVAFYLISKESGVLFSRMLEVVVQSELQTETREFFEPSQVIELLKTFTDALLSIKHLGAIDKIALGLSYFCKKFYEMSNIHYAGLARELLENIMTSLTSGDCQTIFRRSAGLPNAVAALLKAEPIGMKNVTFPKVIQRLHELGEKETPGMPEVRIHGINILRVVFQDAELKQDMEQYIGQGLTLAIRGFSDNDWSVRNSSLMLYAAIMKRLFPNVSNEAQANYRSGLNVIQFFVLRAPSLLKFFFDEILAFSQRSTEHNMYPTLYPISLILSKLLPYDMKPDVEDDKTDRQTTEENTTEATDSQQEEAKPTEQEYKMNEIDDGSKSRFVTATEINQFRGMLLSCASGKNFLGRVLVARAIVPFIAFNDIAAYLDSILPKTLADVKKDHNSAHGRLLIAKFVVNNFRNVCLESNFSFDDGKTAEEVFDQICSVLASRQAEYLKLKCPPVLLTYLEIVNNLCQKMPNQENYHSTCKHFETSLTFARVQIEKVLHQLPLRPPFDVCLGELRKKMVEMVLRSHSEDEVFLKEYLTNLFAVILSNSSKLNTDDTDVLQYSLKYINDSVQGKALSAILADEVLLTKLLTILLDILQTNKKMINLVQYLVDLLTKSMEARANLAVSPQARDMFVQISKLGFEENKENGDLMKELISVAPHFCTKEDASDLSVLSKMLAHYSEPEQKDDNRYNCALALMLLKPRFKSILEKDYKLYLSLQGTLIKLLIDEMAPIRKKVCKILYDPSETLQNENVALTKVFRVVFEDVSSFAEKLSVEKQKELASEVQAFILELICDPISEKYKFMANYDARIFNFDKPNKYKEEVKIMRAVLENLNFLTIRDKFDPTALETYCSTKHVPQPKAFDQEVVAMVEDPYKRNEYITGVAALRLFNTRLCGAEVAAGSPIAFASEYL